MRKAGETKPPYEREKDNLTPTSPRGKLDKRSYTRLSIYLLCVAINVPWILFVATAFLRTKNIEISLWHPIIAAAATLILGFQLVTVIIKGLTEQMRVELRKLEIKENQLDKMLGRK